MYQVPQACLKDAVWKPVGKMRITDDSAHLADTAFDLLPNQRLKRNYTRRTNLLLIQRDILALYRGRNGEPVPSIKLP